MKSDKGQTVLILVLIMTVALAIGLSTVQRSLSDISTSSKVEQSSRAFSAAEAGIERALQVGSTTIQLENQSSAQVSDSSLIPCVPGTTGCAQGAGVQQSPLEYPPLSKEEVAHVWLADYTSTANPPTSAYAQGSLDVYWGSSSTDKAALELTLIYYDDGTKKYQSQKWYLDHSIVRSPENNFVQVSCTGYDVETDVGTKRYQCKKTIDSLPSLPSRLMLLRARLLYNSTSQPLAVQAVGTCGQDCSIPPQARRITSTGAAGETQRKVQLFQVNKVVPPYFDYAIFSAGEISK